MIQQMSLNSIQRVKCLFEPVDVLATPSCLQKEWPCVFPGYLGLALTARPDPATVNHICWGPMDLENQHAKWIVARWRDNAEQPGGRVLDVDEYGNQHLGHCAVVFDCGFHLHPIWIFLMRVFFEEVLMGMAADGKPHRNLVERHLPEGCLQGGCHECRRDGTRVKPVQPPRDRELREFRPRDRLPRVRSFVINAEDLKRELTMGNFLRQCSEVYFPRFSQSWVWPDWEQAHLDKTVRLLSTYSSSPQAAEMRKAALAPEGWCQRFDWRPLEKEAVDFLDC
ncbi:uncharacterized protein E0L32_006023 [Thyridium curvatum]|uniref:Uncharacterized protein n=1 Tax=Thyridium curvatum TaxID=1093900 RepID=A0A507AU95_9PEZI|nr:uncharacterized protein E0L32_006023 [Thyridium curvatum]TPX13552.1 hypothetical protein E0L32_006023 [Thyridium curvatum]